MGVGASRTRKERALNKYTKAVERYDRLKDKNVHINNLYRSSKKSLTWKQKVKKGFSNIYNRIRHFRRRTNNEKIESLYIIDVLYTYLAEKISLLPRITQDLGLGYRE